MAKKNQPYSEIIDVKKELKEYKKLCRGKSKKYTYYLDWKKHILELYKGLDTNDKVINFKHYLINENRINDMIYEPYVPVMLFFYTALISYQIKKMNMNYLIFALVLLVITILLTNANNKKQMCFISDLIEIIEEFENNSETE